MWAVESWYAAAMKLGPEAVTTTAVYIEVAEVTGEFPVFPVASAAVLGGGATVTWDKLEISISSSVVYS